MARRRNKEQEIDFTKIPRAGAPSGVESPDEPETAVATSMEPHEAASYVEQGLQNLGSGAGDWSDDGEQFSNALKHPGLPPELLQSAYEALFPQAEGAEEGREEPTHDTFFDALMENPSLPPHIAEDAFKRTYLSFAPNEQVSKKISDPVVEAVAEKVATRGEPIDIHVSRLYDLRPDFYFNLLQQRPIPEPVTDTMTDAQKATNARVENIDSIVLNGLARTTKHTPETLDKVVEFLVGDKPFGMDQYKLSDAMEHLFGNPNLTSEQIDKLYNTQLPERNRYDQSFPKYKLMEHPNVNPTTVAHAAMSENEESHSDSWARRVALKSPKLPEETRRRIVAKLAEGTDYDSWYKHSDILQNPSLDDHDLRTLYANDRAKDAIIAHPNVTEDLIRDYYKDHKDQLDPMRKLLGKAKSIPKDILLDLVNHKNKELAQAAINHPTADIDVVNAGLKRKAAAVRQAAMRHPLVAGQELMNGLRDKRIKPFDFLQPSNLNALGGRVPEEAARLIAQQHEMSEYNEDLLDLTEKQKFWSVKEYLATHNDIPADIKAKNVEDIAKHFVKVTKTNDTSPWNDYRVGVPYQLASYITDLADSGNPDAQEALLQRPGFLKNADLASDVYSTEYLDKAYDALNEHGANGFWSVYYGRRSKIPKDQMIRDIVNNANTSQKLFDKITLDPTFLKNINNLMVEDVDHHYSSRQQPSPTVFDKRYGDLDDTQKTAAFQKLAALGTIEANHAILLSREAPPDIWRSAFQRMPQQRRRQFLQDHDVSLFADPETFREALMGDYNGHHDWPQLDALKSLDGTQPGDKDLIVSAIRSWAGKQDSDLMPLANEFAMAIHENFMNMDQVKDLIKEANLADATQKLGPAIAVRFAIKSSRRGYSDLDADRLNSRLVSLLNNLDGVPTDQADMVLARRWSGLLQDALLDRHTNDTRYALNAIVGRLNKYGRRVNRLPNGNLDFLVDLQDPEGWGIAELAISMGLVSPNKIFEVSQRNPELAAAGMKGMSHGTRASLLAHMVDTGKVNNATIPHLIPLLNSGIFVDKGYGYRFDDRMYEETKRRVFKFADAVADTDPSLAAQAIARTIGINPTDKANKMPIDYKKRLARDYVEHVETSTRADTAKYEILGNLAGELSKVGADEFIPSKLQRSIADVALKQGNVGAMIALISSNQSTAAVNNRAAEMFSNPDSMSASDMLKLADVLKKDISHSAIKQVVSGIMDKVAALTPEEEPQRAQLLHRAVNGAEKAFLKGNLSVADARYYGSLMNQLVHGDHAGVAASAASAMMAGVTNNDLPHDIKTDLFAKIPDKHVDPSMFVDIKDRAFINSPATIEAAITPNKLACLMNAGAQLEPDRIDVVSSRVFRMIEEGHKLDISKYSILLFRNPEVSTDQAIKVFRGVGGTSRYYVLLNAAHTERGSAPVTSAANILLDEIGQSLTGQAMGINGEPITRASAAHIWSLSLNLKSLSYIIGYILQDAAPDDQGPVRDVAEKYIDQVRQLTDLAKERVDGIEAGIRGMEDGPTTNDYPMEMLNVMAQGASEKFFKFADLMKIIDIGKKARDIDRFYARRVGYRSDQAKLSDFLANYINKFDLTEDEVLSSTKQHPEMLYAMSNRSSVPASVVLNAPVEHLFEHDPRFGKVLGQIVQNIVSEDPDQILSVASKIQQLHRMYSANFSATDYSNAMASMFQKAPQAFSKRRVEAAISVVRAGSKDLNAAVMNTMRVEAVKVGAGGSEFAKDLFDNSKEYGLSRNQLSSILNNGHLDGAAVQAALQKKYEGLDKETVVGLLCTNEHLDKSGVGELVSYVKKMTGQASQIKDAKIALTKHRHISLEDLREFYDETKGQYSTAFRVGDKFHPAFLNPTHGGDLFRSLPISVPKALREYGIKEDSLVKHAEYSQARSRLRQAMAAIPPEGMVWAQFKKANPKMKNWPEVKSLFMSKNNRPATPEDFVEAMRHADASEFHVTYTYWAGAQRHRGGESKSYNLVLQLNTSKAMEEKMAQDPKLLAFFQFVQNAANQTLDAQIGGHPVTPHIAAWVRIDVGGGKKGWIIEELQSDFSQRLYSEIDEVARQYPIGLKIGGHTVTPDEMHKFNDQISDIIKGWYQAGFQATEELAKRHGVENLYMHGIEARAALSGFRPRAERDYPVYLKEIYERYPKQQGWDTVDYSQYPVKNNSFYETLKARPNQRCWLKKLK